MKMNQIFKSLTNGLTLLMKEHRGELHISYDVKMLFIFPAWVFICLPVFVFGIYLIFAEKKIPIGRAGSVHYVEAIDSPLFFYSVFGFCIFAISLLTVVLAVKFLRAIQRIRSNRHRL
jgi:hypothetical protein